MSDVPARQVRARFDDATIDVYQAYPPVIADAALAAGSFVAPFKRDRMTWIKPSFLWMMHRSGWASKPGQERVLAITITRDGFEAALSEASLSSFHPEVHASEAQWREHGRRGAVRVQWDPERSPRLERLDHRSIQIGLSGDAVARYVDDWIVALRDVTATAHEVERLVAAGQVAAAVARLPEERPYPLPERIRARIGAS